MERKKRNTLYAFYSVEKRLTINECIYECIYIYTYIHTSYYCNRENIFFCCQTCLYELQTIVIKTTIISRY